MHQLTVDGAVGGPGVVDYRKDCPIFVSFVIFTVNVIIVINPIGPIPM